MCSSRIRKRETIKHYSISFLLAPLFPREVRETLEFEAACKAYGKHHRYSKIRNTFLDHEQFLLRETQIQCTMGRTGDSRFMISEGVSYLQSILPELIRYRARRTRDRESEGEQRKGRGDRRCEAC
jgi:hypothetical protein